MWPYHPWRNMNKGELSKYFTFHYELTSVILREHTPLTTFTRASGFHEVVLLTSFTSCDELVFPYVLRKLRLLENVNMFPACTFEDLVNNMEHRRKARSQIS